MKKGTKGITTERWQESPLKKAGEIENLTLNVETASFSVHWKLRGDENSRSSLCGVPP